MKGLKLAALASVTATLVAATLLSDRSVAADRGPYLGIGVGASQLDPESSTDALTTLDEEDVGVHALAGYDINRWLSAEGYIADLGSAGIGFLGRDVGDVDYLVYGIRGVGYLWNSRSGFLRSADTDRRGFGVYLSAGIGGMDTDSSLAIRTDYRAHATFAAGVEWGLPRGFAVRAEIAGYDTDARYANVSLLKRFGTRGGAASLAPETVAMAPSEPVAPAPAAALPEPEVQTFFRPVVPPYLYFAFDEVTLTEESIVKLRAFAQEVRGTGLKVEIDGHTDSYGASGYNVALSEQRANAVREQLLQAGIEASRLSVVGVGEARPLESNTTEEGRAVNRRADFTLR